MVDTQNYLLVFYNKVAKRLPKQKMLGPTSSLNEDPKQNAFWEKTNGKDDDPKRRKESWGLDSIRNP